MRVLVCLAEHAGDVVSVNELLDTVWKDLVVTQYSVYQAIAVLRRALGDDPKSPATSRMWLVVGDDGRSPRVV